MYRLFRKTPIAWTSLLYLLVICVILLDLFALVMVAKDNRYLLDSQKPKLYLIIIFIPIFGAIYALVRVGFGVSDFLYPLIKASRTKIKRFPFIGIFKNFFK